MPPILSNNRFAVALPNALIHCGWKKKCHLHPGAPGGTPGSQRQPTRLSAVKSLDSILSQQRHLSVTTCHRTPEQHHWLRAYASGQQPKDPQKWWQSFRLPLHWHPSCTWPPSIDIDLPKFLQKGMSSNSVLPTTWNLQGLNLSQAPVEQHQLAQLQVGVLVTNKCLLDCKFDTHAHFSFEMLKK